MSKRVRMLTVGLMVVLITVANSATFAASKKKPSPPRGPVPQTGQPQCYSSSGTVIPCAETGQDGEFQAGVAWPIPRFTDQGNGTVRDNLTGLIWLKMASCFGERTWFEAIEDTNTLASPNCGLTDGSMAGDWRLPNVKELQSLVDFGHFVVGITLALPTGHPFLNVQFVPYWSSTSVAGTGGAYAVSFYDGRTTAEFGKTFPNNTGWAVRVED